MNWSLFWDISATLITLCWLVLLIIWNVKIDRHRKEQARWEQNLESAVGVANAILEQLDSSQEMLLKAAFMRVASEHIHYSFDDQPLPGLITVKCEDCDEVVGTIDKDSKKPPNDLVMNHVKEKFDELAEQAAEKRKEWMQRVKEEAGAIK